MFETKFQSKMYFKFNYCVVYVCISIIELSNSDQLVLRAIDNSTLLCAPRHDILFWIFVFLWRIESIFFSFSHRFSICSYSVLLIFFSIFTFDEIDFAIVFSFVQLFFSLFCFLFYLICNRMNALGELHWICLRIQISVNI